MTNKNSSDVFYYALSVLIVFAFLTAVLPERSVTGFFTYPFLSTTSEDTLAGRPIVTPRVVSAAGINPKPSLTAIGIGSGMYDSSSRQAIESVNLWTLNKQRLSPVITPKSSATAAPQDRFPPQIQSLISQHNLRLESGAPVQVEHEYCNIGICTATGACAQPSTSNCKLDYKFNRGGRYVGGSGLKLEATKLLVETNCNGKMVEACKEQVVGSESLLKYVLYEEYEGPGKCALAEESEQLLTIKCCGTPTGC